KEIPQCARLGSQSLISRAPAIDVRRTGNEVVLEARLVAMKEFERRPGGRELPVKVGFEKVVDDDVGDRVIDANRAGQATLDVRANRALVDPAHDTHRIQCHCTERIITRHVPRRVHIHHRMPDHARRVLFALNEPGYLRFYGPAIVELERRGWTVSLVYGKPEKRGPDLEVPANAGDRVRSLGTWPGEVSPVAKDLRIAIDCARYVEPAFEKAEYLRRRAERELSPAFAFIRRIQRAPRFVVSAAIGIERFVERLLPVNVAMRDFLKDVRPDLVVVSPLVIIGGSGVQETEVIKAARAIGIPTVVAVASWDHLTSKGLIRLIPDAVIVWNDVQAREAQQLHRIPRNRIIVTGAQSFDRWFDRTRPDAVDAFRRTLGIEANRRVLLLVGSSRNMAPGDSEVHFARRWIAALRTSNDAQVREAFVIIRPHPGNTEPWQHVDLGDPHAVVHPTSYATGVLMSDADIE